MTAGNNVAINIWRIGYISGDDDIGGAIVTGSIVYSHMPARFQAQPAQQLLLQQGLETEELFEVVVQPGTLDIRQRDEVQIVEPFDHQDYNNRFRVINRQYSSLSPRDPRNWINLTVTRSVRAHSEQ
jgi:hypothetical protein